MESKEKTSENYSSNYSNYSNAIIHLYRGELSRQILYRTRLDQSTQWAVTTSAGLSIFVVGNKEVAHYYYSVIVFITSIFLVLEARRYIYYTISRHRVREIERNFYGEYILQIPFSDCSYLNTSSKLVAERIGACFKEKIIPISLFYAFALRLRRVYLGLFVFIYFSWLIKINIHYKFSQEVIISSSIFLCLLVLSGILSYYIERIIGIESSSENSLNDVPKNSSHPSLSSVVY